MDFMEQLADKVSYGTKVLSQKTDEILQMTELRININNIEREIERSKLYIGELVYKYYLNERMPVEEIQQKCREVQNLYYKANRLKERVYTIKGLKYCVNCGESVGDDESFCPKCGKRI